MKRNLIIGKNSQIVAEIAEHLINCDFISHNSVFDVSFDGYDLVFLFSWAHQSLMVNMQLVDSIPMDKLVFISTVAVDSLSVRDQWKRYPCDKAEVENHVLSLGGSVLRLGIWSENVRDQLHGFIPYTDSSMLVDAINHWYFRPRRVYSLFRIEAGAAKCAASILAVRINRLSRAFPQVAIVQAIFEGAIKYGLRSANYSYTGDIVDSCFDELLVGYGALGSAFAEKYPAQRGVIVSGKDDVVLNSRGFRLTWIGRSFIGLSKYWHGVSIKANNDGTLTKHVPLFVPRPRSPSDAIKLHVSDMLIHENFIQLRGETPEGRQRSLYCKRLILAAGPLENCRLLSKLSGLPAILSDHEIGMVGKMLIDDAVKSGFIRKRGPFIFRGKLVQLDVEGVSAIFDIRPHNPIKHIKGSDVNSFYMDSTRGIIVKLLKRFSLMAINEAVFNKLGFSFYTNVCSVFGQVLVKDCIRYDLEGNEYVRRRLSTESKNLLFGMLLKVCPSIILDSNFEAVDGQHIQGGLNLFNSELISNLLRQGRLQILGSPTIVALSSGHNTAFLIDSL